MHFRILRPQNRCTLGFSSTRIGALWISSQKDSMHFKNSLPAESMDFRTLRHKNRCTLDLFPHKNRCTLNLPTHRIDALWASPPTESMHLGFLPRQNRCTVGFFPTRIDALMVFFRSQLMVSMVSPATRPLKNGFRWCLRRRDHWKIGKLSKMTHGQEYFGNHRF